MLNLAYLMECYLSMKMLSVVLIWVVYLGDLFLVKYNFEESHFEPFSVSQFHFCILLFVFSLPMDIGLKSIQNPLQQF